MNPPLEKAVLQRLTDRGQGQEPQAGPDIPVQFNPASLRFTLTSQAEGGSTQGRQVRQFTGNSSTELSFDLHFDTADEAPTGGKAARSVRERTGQIEQFVLPDTTARTAEQRVKPPRVRFIWGDLTVDGVITQLQIDFDLFASDGTPLRAKMGVSLKQQDARYEIKQSQQGQGAAAPPQPGTPPASAPGGQGGGNPDQTALALAGESAADFAARMGLAADAWRGLAAGLDGTLSLEAGISIDFDASLSAGLGVGVTAGAEFGVQASVEAKLGLSGGATASASASASASVSASASASAGFALSAAGGVQAALETATQVRANEAAQQVRGAFAVAAPAARPGLAAQQKATAGAPARAVAPPVPPPPPDPRAATWGFGVPLVQRRTFGEAQVTRTPVVLGTASASQARARSAASVSRPAWEQPPAPVTKAVTAKGRCHCQGRCGCGRGGAR